MSEPVDLDAIRRRYSGEWEVWQSAPAHSAVHALCDEVQRLRKVADAADALYRYAVAEGAAQLDHWNALADTLDVARPLDTPGNEPLDGR